MNGQIVPAISHNQQLTMKLPKDPFAFDADAVIASITETIRRQVGERFRRRGVVIAVSGGIDSSVCAALCARAVGKERVLLLSLPERDSSDDALRLGALLARTLQAPYLVEEIGPALEAGGCYLRQLEAIRMVVPEYGEGWKCKIVIPSILEGDRLNLSRLTVRLPDGTEKTERMPPASYLQLVAATNMKQRTRTAIAYYHADRLNYVVCGTPNRLEYDQGFFVKGGDGLADIKPIAHLYKTQVFMLAEALGVPEEIRNRPPTTDTFSLPQTQEEFYFALPYASMDWCLYGHNNKIPSAELAGILHLTAAQVERVYADIETKRRTTAYLHAGPLLIEEVREIGTH
jgi:NAD+ synthase